MNPDAPHVLPLSPLARAVLDAVGEGVVVFGTDGTLLYANGRARSVLEAFPDANGRPEAETLMPWLARQGGRISPLRIGSTTVGEAVYVPGDENPSSLADRERRAILSTLDRTDWRLAETARVLGISRTTLWRRLKAYGLHRDHRGRTVAESGARSGPDR